MHNCLKMTAKVKSNQIWIRIIHLRNQTIGYLNGLVVKVLM